MSRRRWHQRVGCISIVILIVGKCLFQLNLLPSTKPAAITAVRAKAENENGTRSRIPKQTHLSLSDRPEKIVSNTKLCQQLENPELFHRHDGFSDELHRLDKEYALTNKILQTGWVPGKVQASWVSKIAEAKEPITILALGGSFTRGHGCGETPKQAEKEECSWPARLQRWWQVHFAEEGAVHPAPRLVHMGEHGTGSANALQQMGVIAKSLSHKPDLILIDYLVNDLFFDIHDGFLAFENLLITIRDVLPQAQILVLAAGCSKCIQSEVLDRQRKVVLFHGIPMVDYAAMVQFHNKVNGNPDRADLLWPTTDPEYDGPWTVMGAPWPNFLPAVNVTHRACCANNHPPWPVHQYVADSVAYAITQMLSQEVKCHGSSKITPQHFHPQEELDRYPSCRNPLTFHDAQLSPHGVKTDNNTGWTLYEDKPGRPGWITTTKGSILQFPVQFGDQPVLAITYLRSYENIGRAYVRLRSIEKSKEGESYGYHGGALEKNVSLPETEFFTYHNGIYEPLKSDGWDTANFLKPSWKEGKEGQIYNLEIALEHGSKFKITRVV
eukprot:CAMPEP_0198286396 /NCGR_PEP_ID=MMETSP1449-20131203/5488_1 /TAXON_ID=420275 /ORGANISM="Attheya septentrionalis, Strain CCMP2084" /LENGTH=553 /DNA_ID=CAMNT_0043984121 /DNA_START=123 /DNA_END=1781 /DNA_ORIENTATION=+